MLTCSNHSLHSHPPCHGQCSVPQHRPESAYLLIGANNFAAAPRNHDHGDVAPLLPDDLDLKISDALASLNLRTQSCASNAPITVLEHVLNGDTQLTRLQHTVSLLATALNDASDPLAPARAYRLLAYCRLWEEHGTARDHALRRSGVRGKQARARQIELEHAVNEARSALAAAAVDDADVGIETQHAAEMLAEAQTELEILDVRSASSQAQTVLLGLGFSEKAVEGRLEELSGGWRTRAMLARALCTPCDVLLLDEPTNYLDLPAIVWLTRWVNEGLGGTTVVLVTHDRAFADDVAEELLVLRDGSVERFRGNVSTYERERRKYAKWMK